MKNYWAGKAIDKITSEVIASFTDDELPMMMFEYIWFKVGKEYEKTKQVLVQLPSGFTVIYFIMVLDGEIGNGGFNQYFFNGLDEEIEGQLQALESIGAYDHQRIIREAFRIRDIEKGNAELQHKYAKKTIEAFFSTYEITMLGKCDNDWYALDKDLHRLEVKFIRERANLFITEADR